MDDETRVGLGYVTDAIHALAEYAQKLEARIEAFEKAKEDKEGK